MFLQRRVHFDGRRAEIKCGLESSSAGLRDQPPPRSNYTKGSPLAPTQTYIGPKRRLDEFHQNPSLSKK